MTKRFGHSRLVNLFGSFGYVSLFVQWLWAVVIVGYPYLENGSLSRILQPATPQEPVTIPTPALPQEIAMPLTITITALVLVGTLATLIMLPKTVGKQSARLTHRTTDVAYDSISRRIDPQKRQKRRLSFRILIVLKICLLLVPVLVSLVPAPHTPLDHTIVVIIALYMAVWTGGLFIAQYAMARLKHVDPKTLW